VIGPVPMALTVTWKNDVWENT